MIHPNIQMETTNYKFLSSEFEPCLLTIPMELQFYIFELLDKTSLIKCELVCRKFNQIIKCIRISTMSDDFTWLQNYIGLSQKRKLIHLFGEIYCANNQKIVRIEAQIDSFKLYCLTLKDYVTCPATSNGLEEMSLSATELKKICQEIKKVAYGSLPKSKYRIRLKNKIKLLLTDLFRSPWMVFPSGDFLRPNIP